MITEKTGHPADEEIRLRILNPLGFQPAAWFRCPQNYTIGATGAFTRAEDLVKLGYLCLKGGVYEGRRIVSKEWVRLCESRQYDLYPVENTSFIGKGGMYGQMLMYSHEKEMSVCWLGFGDTPSSHFIGLQEWMKTI